ncbi:MAG: PKD domain-containing protein, partial [Gammaproteobacteria bacterium]
MQAVPVSRAAMKRMARWAAVVLLTMPACQCQCSKSDTGTSQTGQLGASKSQPTGAPKLHVDALKGRDDAAGWSATPLQAGPTLRPMRQRTPLSGQEPEPSPELDEETHAPMALMNAEPTSGGVPLTVEFETIVKMGGAILQIHWDFGDGTQADGNEKQTHVYTKPGEYTALVKVTTVAGEDQDTNDITAEEFGFEVDMRADNESGPAPFTVNFTAEVDEDDAPDAHFMWDFGDGSTGDGSAVEHVYS